MCFIIHYSLRPVRLQRIHRFANKIITSCESYKSVENVLRTLGVEGRYLILFLISLKLISITVSGSGPFPSSGNCWLRGMISQSPSALCHGLEPSFKTDSGPMRWLSLSSGGLLVWHAAPQHARVKSESGGGGGGYGQEKPHDSLSTATLAKPGTKACSAFNKVGCTQQVEHTADLHICTFCLSSVNHQCAHPERFCRRKQYTGTKN